MKKSLQNVSKIPTTKNHFPEIKGFRPRSLNWGTVIIATDCKLRVLCADFSKCGIIRFTKIICRRN